MASSAPRISAGETSGHGRRGAAVALAGDDQGGTAIAPSCPGDPGRPRQRCHRRRNERGSLRRSIVATASISAGRLARNSGCTSARALRRSARTAAPCHAQRSATPARSSSVRSNTLAMMASRAIRSGAFRVNASAIRPPNEKPASANDCSSGTSAAINVRADRRNRRGVHPRRWAACTMAQQIRQ